MTSPITGSTSEEEVPAPFSGGVPGPHPDHVRGLTCGSSPVGSRCDRFRAHGSGMGVPDHHRTPGSRGWLPSGMPRRDSASHCISTHQERLPCGSARQRSRPEPPWRPGAGTWSPPPMTQKPGAVPRPPALRRSAIRGAQHQQRDGQRRDRDLGVRRCAGDGGAPTREDGPGQVASHLNGKLDRPRLTGRALASDEIVALAWDAAPQERERDLVAAWDFSLDIGTDRITDLGPNELHGHTVNCHEVVKGFNWSSAERVGATLLMSTARSISTTTTTTTPAGRPTSTTCSGSLPKRRLRRSPARRR